MEKVFVYKCPNCGGKVNYIDNKWYCDYCKNTYLSLFVQDTNNTLTDYKTEACKLFYFILFVKNVINNM